MSCKIDVLYFTGQSFSLFQSIHYDVGDVLEVLPSQDPVAVDAFMKRCNLNPEAYITVSSPLNVVVCLSFYRIYVLRLEL